MASWETRKLRKHSELLTRLKNLRRGIMEHRAQVQEQLKQRDTDGALVTDGVGEDVHAPGGAGVSGSPDRGGAQGA